MKLANLTISVLFAATAAVAAPLEENDAASALEALELFYINSPEIGYDPVSCKTKDDSERTWIFCRKSGTDGAGGLYIAGLDESGQLHVWPGNGKARQHILKRTQKIEDVNLRQIPVTEWIGDNGIISDGRALFD